MGEIWTGCMGRTNRKLELKILSHSPFQVIRLGVRCTSTLPNVVKTSPRAFGSSVPYLALMGGWILPQSCRF